VDWMDRTPESLSLLVMVFLSVGVGRTFPVFVVFVDTYVPADVPA
jgi:hypothetical protein